jgi:hypothetical protein
LRTKILLAFRALHMTLKTGRSECTKSVNQLRHSQFSHVREFHELSTKCLWILLPHAYVRAKKKEVCEKSGKQRLTTLMLSILLVLYCVGLV